MDELDKIGSADKIFSALIDMEFEPKTTFPIYMVVSMYM
jgi:hypothetical protein